MNKKSWIIVLVIIVLGVLYFLFTDNVEESSAMSFFITSENPGNGANYGGLLGADTHCQSLAEDAGVGDRTWKAYLSSSVEDARDRIGNGPWYNYEGVLIANNVEELHNESNPINKEVGLDENGNTVNGRGDSPNLHDILTGSNADGTLAVGEDGADTTCFDWTSESEEGSAIVGHHDRLGPDTLETASSWNAAHPSRGCSLENLNSTGGGGLLYCFATE